MITLRQLATIGISTTYARMLGGNKIKHYYVTYARALTDSRAAEEMIVEYVRKETGEDVVIETRKINNAYGIDSASIQVAKDVLDDFPNVKKQLEKCEVKSLLHQYNQQDEWYKYLLNPIAHVWNWFASKINAKWSITQWEELGGYPETKLGRRGLFALRDRIKSIPLMPIAGWRRQVTPCRYLTVTFDESNRDQAVKTLQKDLQILADKKLIMGHLAMPFQIQLADVVGSGELSYVLACFLFIDDRRFEKLIGKKKFREEGYKPLSLKTLLGLKTEAVEGSLGYADFRKKWEIEEVNIFEHERQERWDTYVDSFENPKLAGITFKEGQIEREAQIKSFEEHQKAIEKHQKELFEKRQQKKKQ